jgi:hypothetical protein
MRPASTRLPEGETRAPARWSWFRSTPSVGRAVAMASAPRRNLPASTRSGTVISGRERGPGRLRRAQEAERHPAAPALGKDRPHGAQHPPQVRVERDGGEAQEAGDPAGIVPWSQPSHSRWQHGLPWGASTEPTSAISPARARSQRERQSSGRSSTPAEPSRRRSRPPNTRGTRPARRSARSASRRVRSVASLRRRPGSAPRARAGPWPAPRWAAGPPRRAPRCRPGPGRPSRDPPRPWRSASRGVRCGAPGSRPAAPSRPGRRGACRRGPAGPS